MVLTGCSCVGESAYPSAREFETSAWVPVCDIYATAERDVVIDVELPGFDRKDIDLAVDGRSLTLRGTRPAATDAEGSVRRERWSGQFVRSFWLPATVDPASVTAAYADGVLRITVPAREDAKPRRVPVAVAA